MFWLQVQAFFPPPTPAPHSHIQHCRLRVGWDLLNPLNQGRRHLLWQFLRRLENQVSVCHQRLSLPCVMMISILLPWKLSGPASLFICRIFSVVSKNRCGLVEHSTATTFFFFLQVSLTLVAFTNFPNVTQSPSGAICQRCSQMTYLVVFLCVLRDAILDKKKLSEP